MKNLGQFVQGMDITSKGGQIVHPFYYVFTIKLVVFLR